MNAEEKLKKMRCKLLSMQLALENYEDDNGTKTSLIEEGHIALGKFRDECLSMSSEEQLKKANDIIKIYNKAFDLIGRDNFIFYDDGDINYIWKGKKNNE
jgi:hypothetical protein